ncbi:hypothetical protein L204_104146 [Cryptococcus depauperatus]
MEEISLMENLEMMKMLKEEMQRMRIQQAELVEENRMLRANSVDVTRTPVHSSNKRTVEPERFDGTRPAALAHFLFQCRNEFAQNPGNYLSEEAKVTFAISYLTGAAAEAAVLCLRGNACPWKHSFDNFERFLMDGWGIPIERSTARQQLQKITQGSRTAKEFFTEFEKYRVMLSDYPLDAIIGFAENGLEMEVLRNMARKKVEQWTTFEEYKEEAVQADEYRRKMEELDKAKKSRYHASRPAPSKPSTTGVYTTPATISGDPPVEWINGQLTASEKEWRRNNLRCLRCRAPGHVAFHCPTANRPARHVQVEVKEESNVDK